MSWSWGGYNTNGLILNEESFKNILRFGTEKTKEELQNYEEEGDTIEHILEIGDMTEISYCFSGIDMSYLTVGSFAKLVGFQNGYEVFDETDIYFEDEPVFLICLQKDTLLNKYDSYEEIVKEVERYVVEELGVDIDKLYAELGTDYLKDRIGNLNGFYSDR